MSNSLQPMDCSLPGSSVHRDFLGKNTGVGSCSFLQGFFPTQGLNTGLQHCRWIIYHLSHQGSPCSSLGSFNIYLGFSGGSAIKYLLAMQKVGFDPWVRKIPWRRKWQPTPAFLPGESHGQRSLAGLQSMGLQKLGMT